MVWLVIFVVVVIVVAAAASHDASSAVSMTKAFSSIFGNEENFRKYWRFMHMHFLHAPLDVDKENEIVSIFLEKHIAHCAQASNIDVGNIKQVSKFLDKSQEELDRQVSLKIDPRLSSAMGNRAKVDKARKKFIKDVIGMG